MKIDFGVGQNRVLSMRKYCNISMYSNCIRFLPRRGTTRAFCCTSKGSLLSWGREFAERGSGDPEHSEDKDREVKKILEFRSNLGEEKMGPTPRAMTRAMVFKKFG